MPLWDLDVPAGDQAATPAKPGVWCLDGRHWLTHPVSIAHKRGPGCRRNRGIEVPPPRRPARLAGVRGWEIPRQGDLLEDQDQELDEKEHAVAIIGLADTPELLRVQVDGRQGFVVLPQGKDSDPLIFASLVAFRAWAGALAELAADAESAEKYAEWLGTHQPSEGGAL